MHVLVLGTGRSGQAAKMLLEAKGHQVDMCEDVGGPYDLAVISPGIRLDDPRCESLRAAGTEMIGELELGLRHLSARAVGVTGTNGKSTTVALCAHMLNQAGVSAVACGNNGYALCQALVEKPETEVFVIEMSSYQLELASSPVLEKGVILNVTPDHMDRYKDFESYRAAKERIGLLAKEVRKELTIEEAAMWLTGLSAEYARGFKKLEHRLEDVRTVRGVRFVNDSKATNVEACAYGVQQLGSSLIVLAGGLGKGADFSKLSGPFEGRVKKLMVFGEAAKDIEAALQDRFNIERCLNLEEAIKKAFNKARDGDTIVLSPGCSSFDQFIDFEERGREFKRYVMELTDES